ncbi:MAG: class I SAM-dependent methyltransferase [bacterium]|nr:class I SAM-dependent methyltransferase [bacterium]
MAQEPVKPSQGIVREASPLTAELVAGARARFENSPEARAMVTFSGHVLARMFHTIASESIVNTGTARDVTMNYLVEAHLPTDGTRRTFVDLACGYSSRGAVLARQRPDLDVIEIDLPPVVKEKRIRYARAAIKLPENHRFITADLKTSALHEMLGDVRADVVMARGLLIYFDMPTITSAIQHILTGIKPGGRLIADLVYNAGDRLSGFGQVVNFIRRDTHSDASRGQFESPEAAAALFAANGYADVRAETIESTAKRAGYEKPLNNLMILVDAGRPV